MTDELEWTLPDSYKVHSSTPWSAEIGTFVQHSLQDTNSCCVLTIDRLSHPREGNDSYPLKTLEFPNIYWTKQKTF